MGSAREVQRRRLRPAGSGGYAESKRAVRSGEQDGAVAFVLAIR